MGDPYPWARPGRPGQGAFRQREGDPPPLLRPRDPPPLDAGRAPAARQAGPASSRVARDAPRFSHRVQLGLACFACYLGGALVREFAYSFVGGRHL